MVQKVWFTSNKWENSKIYKGKKCFPFNPGLVCLILSIFLDHIAISANLGPPSKLSFPVRISVYKSVPLSISGMQYFKCDIFHKSHCKKQMFSIRLLCAMFG